MKVLTSRELDRRPGGAKRFAKAGPVIITKRGQPSHVLVSIDEYRRLLLSEGSDAQELPVSSEPDSPAAP